jgi:tetratricopeptide (TPR) repeat protein
MPRIDDLTRLLAKEPTDPFLLYSLAQEHAKLKTPADLAKAVDFYDRCLAVDPAYCYAYFHKAQTLRSLSRDADAIATLHAGLAAARAARDTKAQNELASLLDELT